MLKEKDLKRATIIEACINGTCTIKKAAFILGLSERRVKQIKKTYAPISKNQGALFRAPWFLLILIKIFFSCFNSTLHQVTYYKYYNFPKLLYFFVFHCHFLVND